jgi:hypothetical protein
MFTLTGLVYPLYAPFGDGGLRLIVVVGGVMSVSALEDRVSRSSPATSS